MNIRDTKLIISKITEYLNNNKISNNHCISIISSKDVIENIIAFIDIIYKSPECIENTMLPFPITIGAIAGKEINFVASDRIEDNSVYIHIWSKCKEDEYDAKVKIDWR